MSVKKRGLGKGLSALISDELINDNDEKSKDSIINIDISLIIPNKEQPRQNFEQEALEDLANSIKIYGLLQPILLRKVGKKYEIVAGERRWRACKMAGLKEVPALIRELSQQESAKIALIENIQREDLNPIEEAMAYKKLMEDYKLTQEEVSSQVGKSRSYIANSIRLLNLGENITKFVAQGKLTTGHGKALLGIKDKNEQLKTAEKIITEKLNVRQTEEITNSKKISVNNVEENLRDTHIISLEEELMRSLGTKVNLVPGVKKGKIEIEYYGDEDLDRIIDVLLS
jgi:ParB family chromosome partitioning protein